MVSKPDDPIWFRAADRFGITAAFLAFSCALLWYGGGWTGRELIKPAVDRVVDRVCAGLDKNIEVMDRVSQTLPEIAGTQRVQARTTEQQAKNTEAIAQLLSRMDSRLSVIERGVEILKGKMASIAFPGPGDKPVAVEPRGEKEPDL